MTYDRHLRSWRTAGLAAALALSAVLTSGCGTDEPAPSRPAAELASLPMYDGTDAEYAEALDSCERVSTAYEPFREAVESGDLSVETLNPLLTDLEDATPNKVHGLEAIKMPYYNVFGALGGVDSELRFGRADPAALDKLLQRARAFRTACIDVAAVDELRD